MNLLKDSNSEESKFATKMWYVIDGQTKKDEQKQSDTIKFETETIKPSLCDYSDAFIQLQEILQLTQPMIQLQRLKIVHNFLHVKQ